MPWTLLTDTTGTGKYSNSHRSKSYVDIQGNSKIVK